MRVLVLGAGALGGYFGGRLAQAGADVTWLVRPARAARLAAEGLRITSPFGDAALPVRTVTAAGPGYDLALLTCKAFDLDGAIDALLPARPGIVLPVLNGLSHIEALQAAFGADRVLGGLAKIQATLAPDGTVRQLNDWRWITFGELEGGLSARTEAVAALFAPATGVVAEAVPERLVLMAASHTGAALGPVLSRAVPTETLAAA